MNALALGIAAIERGLVPDILTRRAIRRLCWQRLRETGRQLAHHDATEHTEFLASLRTGPIAPVPHLANQQHYELPADFFAAILGPHRKYSCCYFPRVGATLAEAEEAALALTCQHADISDGQDILELGCGWGSLALYMANRFPQSRVTAVSNSHSQRTYILSQARSRGLSNLQVITADMNDFSPGHEKFDRVVSVEMFEHMRNFDRLLERIATWLTPGGKLFVHIFCHRQHAYPFESTGTANWMGRHFFTGGIMPSVDLLKQFDRDMVVQRQYEWNGRHYQQTAEAWLANLDARRRHIEPVLASVYGTDLARVWLNRWRMFFLAVSELFGFAEGREWFVGHYVLEHASTARLVKSCKA